MGFLAKLMETHSDSGTDYNKFTLLSDDESNDATIADYPVEAGTDGIWTYRKWASGIAECWGYISATSTSLSTSYGSLYYGSQKTQAFPSGLFVDFPKFINVQAYDNGNGTQASVSTWTKDDASWYPYGLHNTTINVGYTVEAKGRWK